MAEETMYERNQTLNEYLLFHYGTKDEILPADYEFAAGMEKALHFPIRTASHFSRSECERGLDLGCAVGRSSFEMGRICKSVLGIDYSHSFIEAATAIGKRTPLRYSRKDEGHLVKELTVKLDPSLTLEHVRFQQGDAMDLPEHLGSFDCVHAANLLCRLSEPRRLLQRFPKLVNPGGSLVLATPCTWLEDFTPKTNWPTGSTEEWLRNELETTFTLMKKVNEPFLIRETARKFQWTNSMLTVWERK